MRSTFIIRAESLGAAQRMVQGMMNILNNKTGLVYLLELGNEIDNNLWEVHSSLREI